MAQSVQVKSVNHRHEALADIMLTEPHLTLEEIGKRLQLSVAWLSIVKNSDSFKDYWALRRKTHGDAITAGIKEKAAAIAELSLDTLLEDIVVRREAQAMTATEARENLDLIRRFGFDGIGNPQPKNQAPTVNLNFGVVSSEALASARAKLRAATPVLDAEAVPAKLEDKS